MRRPAYALATVLILMGVALFGVGAIITISTLESKIANSQREGITAYYVAEAGVEDALWRLSTNQSNYSTQLQNNTLNTSYSSVPNVPESGQNFIVTLESDTILGDGYGIINVTGYSNNGTFTSQRRIQAKVFQGSAASAMGTNAYMAGGSMSFTNNLTNFIVRGGDVYANAGYVVNGNSGLVDLGTSNFYTRGGSTPCDGVTVICGAVVTSAPAQTMPGFDFSKVNSGNPYNIAVANGGYYASGAEFEDDYKNNSFPNSPVLWVDGDVSFSGGTFNNTSATYSGMIVIAGTFNLSKNTTHLTILDPGTGRAGLFIRDNFNTNAGMLDIEGVLYVAGAFSNNNGEQWNITGGLVVVGTSNLNTGVRMNLIFDPNRILALSGGLPSVVQIRHWEEEY